MSGVLHPFLFLAVGVMALVFALFVGGLLFGFPLVCCPNGSTCNNTVEAVFNSLLFAKCKGDGENFYRRKKAGISLPFLFSKILLALFRVISFLLLACDFG